MVVDDGRRRSRRERTDERETWTTGDNDDGEGGHRVTGCGRALLPTTTTSTTNPHRKILANFTEVDRIGPQLSKNWVNVHSRR